MRVHGTLQPLRSEAAEPLPAAGAITDRLMWAALVPLLLLLRPYEGLIQDARIYIGRGVADHDPAGVGTDILFTSDGQTGFTALRPVIRLLLDILTPAQASTALALFGSLVWLLAVVALVRGLAGGRTAWAAAVCILALPADYGAFKTFCYGETIATPRVFAEAAVLGAFAALVHRRRLAAVALLGIALALHPLMALPGLAVAAVMLASEDRRWLLPIGAAVVAVAGAAALRLPLADRLFTPMDPAWYGILRVRSQNLFPSLWKPEVFAAAAARLAAVVLAAPLAKPRVRALLVAVAAVAIGGLATTALFGDRFPLVLVTQLQTWRALWPLALMGNAGVALAAVGLWRGGPGARLSLACLGLTWLSLQTPPLAIGLAAVTVGLRVADLRGGLACLSPRVGHIAVAATLALGALDTAELGRGLAAYLAAGREQDGEILYSLMLSSEVQAWPLALAAIALALWRRSDELFRRRAAVAASVLALAATCSAALLLWDSRTGEYRLVDARGEAAAEIGRLIGSAPGPVLWIDEYNEPWFFADRPSFFNAMQAGPILFSRELAFAWHARAERLLALGLARPTDLSPWTPAKPGDRVTDLRLSAAAVEAVCGDPVRPAAIVAPGAQRDAAPAGWSAALWRPPVVIQRLSSDGEGIYWRKIDTFTVVRCPSTAPAPPA